MRSGLAAGPSGRSRGPKLTISAGALIPVPSPGWEKGTRAKVRVFRVNLQKGRVRPVGSFSREPVVMFGSMPDAPSRRSGRSPLP
jgi:hypothetical protein